MLSFNPNKENCTGCAACYSICPVKCITMVPDEEGFLYPTASEACINCHLCEKVCPMNQSKLKNDHKKQAVAALTKDYEIWKRSASGGAFSEICRTWADENTLIVGAAWHGLKVHHIGVLGFKNITPLCKSKYISSAIDNSFIYIQQHLRKGHKVIFCGCPCQVDGLVHFLRNKKHDNLLLIDLICHGQGSPAVFEASMEVLSKQLDAKVINYQFRAKRRVHECDYLALVETTKARQYILNDPYIQLFLSQNAIRPSCGKHCQYRNPNRPSDLTIADYKGLTKIFPQLLGTKKNYSTIISNTQKGEHALNMLNQVMKIYPSTINDIIKYNPLFAHQTSFSENRNQFFHDFKQDPQNAILKWTRPYELANYTFKHKIFDILPEWLRKLILKLLYKSK